MVNKRKKKLLEMKTKLDGINSILVIVEKKISEFEDMAIEPSTIKSSKKFKASVNLGTTLSCLLYT